MDDRRQQEYQQAFLRLQQAYIRRLENTVRIIDNIFELKKISPLLRGDLVRVQSLVHGLAGSGSTFGYPEISMVGAQADNFITDILIKPTLPSADYDQLDGILKNIQKTCQSTASRAHAVLPMPPKAPVPAGRHEDMNILIVDDDGDVAAAIAHGLEPSGVKIKICTSGEEALHYLPRLQPDLVILDVALSGIDGLEVLKHIKQNPEFIDVPVIIICTRHNDEMEKISLRAGAQGFIAKPLDIEVFTERVKEYLPPQSAQAGMRKSAL